MFKSTKTFNAKKFFGKKNKDVIIRNIMYLNQDHELKILTQHPSAISASTLKDDDADDEDESGGSE